jgi:hypothetical protein
MYGARNLKICQFLSVLLGLMTLIALGFIAWEIFNLTTTSRQTNWLIQTNRLVNHVINANSTQAKERGLTNILIFQPKLATDEIRAKLHDLRATGDAHYRQALTIASEIIGWHPLHPLNESLQTLTRHRLALENARTLADRTLDNKNIFMVKESWIDTINAFITSLAQLRRDALAPMNEFNRAYYNNLLNKEILFSASDYAGRERAIIGGAIAESRPLSMEEALTLQFYRAIVEDKLELLALETKKTHSGLQLKKAMDRLNEAFLGRYQRLRVAVHAANEQRAPYPIDAISWFTEASRGIDSILAVSAVISQHTELSTRALQQQKARETRLLVVVICVTLAVIFAIVILLRRRLFLPLQVLTTAAERIASGNLHRPVMVSGNDEFTILARSFEHMRQSLLSDIIERERIKTALQESETRNRAIVETAVDGIITIDESGFIDTFNLAAEKIFGYRADEIVGRNIATLMPETYHNDHNNGLTHYLRTGKAKILGHDKIEVTGLRKDGVAFPIELSMSAMHVGESQLFTGIMRDITQRKQAEDELRTSEERFALITRGTKDGIWDWDLTTGQIYFSPRWKAMLGYDNTDIKNNFQALQSLIHPDDLGTALNDWITCMEGETDAFVIEYRLRNKQNEYRWIQCRGLALHNKQGNPVRMAGSHTDITKSRHAYVDLQQMATELEAKAKALEASNKELDQFAYIASHDLKAPLRAIANLSQWIEEDLQEAMTDDTRQQMALLRSRVQRMEGLINGVLQYSRVGRINIEIEDVDVGQLLAEVVDGLAPPPGFHIDIATDMPTLPTARVPLSQIFANLLSNAIKYHHRPESAQITVSVQPLNTATYEFAVTDDGPGIDPAYHDKVFEIFQTLNARDKVESTGVGLTVVKKIIEQLGGEISLDSAEGEGATFRFTLPKHHIEDVSASQQS